MERVCEELDEAKAEIEKLRKEYKTKAELSESLKRSYNEQLIKIQEANGKIEKQSQELNEKADEISFTKQMYEELKSSMKEKEAIIKHLNSTNDKLRVNCDEKVRKWEEENGALVVALDEANSKNMDQEQKLHEYKGEVKGLKALLSASEKKCFESEKKAKASEELRQRDDMLLKLEEENIKVEDQLKWKKEQFKHLEDALEKLRGQFQASKKEWELEKSTLIDEISTLQTSLDSQRRISEGLQGQLRMCNQALAHEESRRKYLEVQLSETKTCFDNVFTECEEAKSKVEYLTGQRDKEIASLRGLLGTKVMLHKEMEYKVGRLDQENRELQSSLKELQEAQIQEAGTSSSMSKLRNKLKGLEQMHRDCSKNLRANEAEWASRLEKMAEELTSCRSELESKDAVIIELKMQLEGCHSLISHLEFQNEDKSLMLLILKSEILEAQLKFANEMADVDLKNSEREEKISLLMKQLEMKSADLVKSQTKIEEDREKMTALLCKVESSSLVEQEKLQLQDEIRERQKKISLLTKQLEMKSADLVKAQIKIEEDCEEMTALLGKVEYSSLAEQEQLQLQDESQEREDKISLLMKKLEMKSANLVNAQMKIEEDREKMTALLGKVESSSLVEQEQLQLQDEIREREDKISLLMKQLEMKSADLIKAQMKIEEDREKMAALLGKVESSSLVEQEKLQLQDEIREREEKISLLMKQLERKSAALFKAETNIEEEHEKITALSGKVESLSQQQLQFKDELQDREEKISLLRKQLEMKSAALVKAQTNIEEDREKITALLGRVESLSLVKQLQLQLQDELQRHKEMLKESSECHLHLKEQALQMACDLKKVRAALNRANDELAEKFCEGNELEFELHVWKSIAERLKANLEENQQMRKQVEVSLLAEVEVEVALKQEKESLGHMLEEKDRRIDDLQRQLVSLDQKLKNRETGSSSPASTETVTPCELNSRTPLLQRGKEKETSNDFQNEIECLEEELVRREMEGAVLAHINAERTCEHEKDNFQRIVEERDQRIDVLHQFLMSLEKHFGSSTTSFSSQLEEKQAELNLLHKAWERITTTEVLKEIEIQEKMLVIAEQENDFSNLQTKLELQQKNLSSSKEEKEEISGELKAKQLEIKKLASDLRTSDAIIDKLESENQTLLDDVKKLLSDRESLVDFIGNLSERLSEFSAEELQLMGIWDRIAQNFDNNRRGVDMKGDDDDLFDPLKENTNIHPSFITKTAEEATVDERSPLRALNN